MTERGDISSRGPTLTAIRDLDRRQTALHEGPCITAIDDPPVDGLVYARDLAAPPDSERWPNFAPDAVSAGYRSLLSTQLSAASDTRAALNLYSHTPAGFTDDSVTLAGLFGVQAGLLLYGANHATHMEEALGTRDVIGQAKGILMERFDVDEDRAFQMLVRSSQDTNIRLVDVARWLISPDGRSSRSGGTAG